MASAAITAAMVLTSIAIVEEPAAGAADAATGTVQGTVISDLDLKPAAGITLTLRRDLGCGDGGFVVGSTTSSDEGQFVFTDVPSSALCPPGRVDVYVLTADVPGSPQYSPAEIRFPPSPLPEQADIVIPTFARVTGLVETQDGETAVPGARVEFAKGKDSPFRATTDADGRYEVFVAHHSDYSVRVRPPASSNTFWSTTQNVRIEEDDEVDLPIDRAMVIAGALTNATNGAPISGLQVSSISVSTPGAKPIESAPAITDINGRYSLETFGAAGWMISLSIVDPTGEYANATSPEFVGSPNITRDFDLGLEKGAFVSGVVKNSDGVSESPLIDVDVTVQAAGQIEPEFTARTNAQGAYRIQGVPPGMYTVSFSSAFGYLGQRWDNLPLASAGNLVELSAGERRTNIDATLVRPAVVRGKVTLAAPSNAELVKIELARMDGTYTYQATTDLTGSYSFNDVLQGDYTMSFLAPDSTHRTVYSGGGIDPASATTIRVSPSDQIVANASLPIVAAPSSTSRVDGKDRFAVAVKVATKAFPDGADTVYIVTGDSYPDALSAGPAAIAEDAPLLLTPGRQLPNSVTAEIRRLKPSKIVVVGGPNSVSPGVFAALKAIVPNTVRVGGTDRYDASRNVAEYAFSNGSAGVYIATGTNFPDALSAGAAAGSKSAPVILVDGSAAAISPETRVTLEELGAQNITIAGGPLSVSPAIERDLAKIAPTVRLAGSDRYAASATINREAFKFSSEAFLVTGTKFPDALAGAAWAGSIDAPLYVSQPHCVPQGTLDAMAEQAVTHVTLIGGTASLSSSVASLDPC